MRILIMCISLLWYQLQGAAPAAPQPATQTTSSLILLFDEQKSQQPTTDTTICIFVPSSIQPLTETDTNLYKTFFSNMIIPPSFFKLKSPAEGLKPFVFLYNWVDKSEGSTNIKNQSERFVTDLLQLKKQYPKHYFLIISTGRGSVLVNAATQLATCKTTVDAIVQIGTPIYDGMYPNPTKCSLFFNIYNDIPYNFKFPLNHAHLTIQNMYNPSKKFKPYNILLLVNNTHLSLQKLFIPPAKNACLLIGAQLLYVCKEANTLFTNYRNVWGSISDKKPKTNLLMGTMQNKLPYTKSPTRNELALSGKNSDIYNTYWNQSLKTQQKRTRAGTSMKDHVQVSVGTKLRSQYSAQAKPLQKLAYQTT